MLFRSQRAAEAQAGARCGWGRLHGDAAARGHGAQEGWVVGSGQ